MRCRPRWRDVESRCRFASRKLTVQPQAQQHVRLMLRMRRPIAGTTPVAGKGSRRVFSGAPMYRCRAFAVLAILALAAPTLAVAGAACCGAQDVVKACCRTQAHGCCKVKPAPTPVSSKGEPGSAAGAVRPVLALAPIPAVEPA